MPRFKLKYEYSGGEPVTNYGTAKRINIYPDRIALYTERYPGSPQIVEKSRIQFLSVDGETIIPGGDENE